MKVSFETFNTGCGCHDGFLEQRFFFLYVFFLNNTPQ